MDCDRVVCSSELFNEIPAESVKAAMAMARRATARRGTCFYRNGEPAQRLFLLVSGCVRLRLVTPSGKSVLFRFIRPGDFFGQQAILSHPAKYFAMAEAAEASVAFCWPRAATQQLLRSHCDIALNAVAVSIRRMQEYQERLAELVSVPVSARLARSLLRLESHDPRTADVAIIDGTCTRGDLAGLSGSTVCTVSRILGRWQRQLIVEKGRATVRILRRARLSRIAGL